MLLPCASFDVDFDTEELVLVEGDHPRPDLSRNAILGCLVLEDVPAKGIVNAMVFFPPAQDAPPMLFEGSGVASSSTKKWGTERMGSD